jgi:hypothetical protein
VKRSWKWSKTEQEEQRKEGVKRKENKIRGTRGRGWGKSGVSRTRRSGRRKRWEQ